MFEGIWLDSVVYGNDTFLNVSFLFLFLVLKENKKNNIILARKVITMYEWIKGSVYNMVITLYPSNITLNSTIAAKLKDIRWVMLGLDKEEHKLAIKPVTKREIDLKLVDVDNLHKVHIGKGYGRITSKAMMSEITNLLARDITGLKVSAIIDEKENLIIADLNDIE